MLTKTQVELLRRSKPVGRNRLSRAKRLAEARQVDIAAGTGFTQGYISKIETGDYTDLPGETMRAFATFFGCTIEDLFPPRESHAVAS